MLLRLAAVSFLKALLQIATTLVRHALDFRIGGANFSV
jgi:hypothetical protein